MSLPPPSEKRRFVEQMFDRIAPRYDLMNRLMTFGTDRAWRRAAVEALGLEPGSRVLDLGCGTGELAGAAAAAGALVIGVDFSAGMLALAAGRCRHCLFARADAQRLPFSDRSFDGAVTGFALRNFTSIPAAIAESARVLRPGGRIALLEVDLPASPLKRRAFRLYFNRVVPWLGGIFSLRYAYAYLSASVAYLPPAAELRAMLSQAGFAAIEKQALGPSRPQLVPPPRRNGP